MGNCLKSTSSHESQHEISQGDTQDVNKTTKQQQESQNHSKSKNLPQEDPQAITQNNSGNEDNNNKKEQEQQQQNNQKRQQQYEEKQQQKKIQIQQQQQQQQQEEQRRQEISQQQKQQQQFWQQQQLNKDEQQRLKMMELQERKRQQEQQKDNEKIEKLYQKLLEKRENNKPLYGFEKGLGEESEVFYNQLTIYRQNKKKLQDLFQGNLQVGSDKEYLNFQIAQIQNVGNLQKVLQLNQVKAFKLNFMFQENKQQQEGDSKIVELFQGLSKSDYQAVYVNLNSCEISQRCVRSIVEFVKKQKQLKSIVVKMQNCQEVSSQEGEKLVQEILGVKGVQYMEVDFGGCLQIEESIVEKVGEQLVQLNNFRLCMWGTQAVGNSVQRFLQLANNNNKI